MPIGWSALECSGWADNPAEALPPTVIPRAANDSTAAALNVEDRLVYLDLDGVLVDFVDRAYEACGIECRDSRKALANTVRHWGDVHTPLGLSQNAMWRAIDAMGEGFWSHASPCSGWLEALRTVESMGRVYLCSSPSKLAESRSGKHKWVQRWMPEYADRLILTAEKWQLAQAGRVLIDDSPANCEAFIAHGGEALLVSHPYNKDSALPRFRAGRSMV